MRAKEKQDPPPQFTSQWIEINRGRPSPSIVPVEHVFFLLRTSSGNFVFDPTQSRCFELQATDNYKWQLLVSLSYNSEPPSDQKKISRNSDWMLDHPFVASRHHCVMQLLTPFDSHSPHSPTCRKDEVHMRIKGRALTMSEFGLVAGGEGGTKLLEDQLAFIETSLF